jgi:hypothetical protein
LAANHEREAASVDDFAEQAARYAENAGRLEALERSSDGLTAKTGRCLQDRVRRRAETVRAAHEAQDKGAKDSQPYLAQDTVAGS